MTNKPKVSTSANRDNIARENERRIIEILKENPLGYNPKTLSRILNINYNTLKSMLGRLKDILTKENGIYRLVDKYRDGSIFDWKIHNVALTTSIPGYSGERINLKFDFCPCKYKFELGKESKKATYRVASSKSPLEISSIYSIYLNFALLTEKYSGYFPPTAEVMASSIEFNKDYINLRLDGINCITLDSLFEQFRIYEKGKFLRLEHKIKVPFELDILMEMLNKSSNSVEIYNELCQIRKERKEIRKSQKNIIGLLNALLKKQDENPSYL
jgi:hypothetical protein